MATISVKQEYEKVLKDLASTMLDVARESVTLIKRSDQAQTLKWTRSQEWNVCLEFLKVMFNIADRLSAFYIPIQSQPEFMDSLEDAVSAQLKTVVAPSLTSSEIDDMEVVVAIGKTVSESRTMYERYKFVVTEESKEKDGFFQLVGGQVASKAGAEKSEAIRSTADLCARAVIPAMKALFEGKSPSSEEASQSSQETSPSSETTPAQTPSSPTPPTTQNIKLVSVLAQISGEAVETRWGVPPRFQRDLKPEEANQLAEHMNRVTRILGERFAVVSSKMSEENPGQVGHA